MPFHDGGLSFRNNPLVNSVFTQRFEEQGFVPPPSDPSFRLEVKTNNPGTSGATQYHLPIVNAVGHSFDFIVDWGDGNSDHITDADQAEALHTYAMAGTYDVVITGECYGVTFQFRDPRKVLNISNWGTIRLTQGTAGLMFSGCTNLTITATDILDLTGVTSFSQAFQNCSSLTTVPNMDQWQTGAITTFFRCFSGCVLFNTPLNGWDVSSATTMREFFAACAMFNQDLNSWDVSNVTTFLQCFQDCIAFNGNISSWVPSAATNMSYMFWNCILFNGNLGSWDVQNLQNATGMFRGCSSYNQSINTWTTTALLFTSEMFFDCTVYNQPMDAVSMGLVQNANSMFYMCIAFDQDISDWSMSNCVSMALMFYGCAVFTNGGIALSWNVNACSDFNNMFNGCLLFNSPLNLWNINASLSPDMSQMFQNAESFNQDISMWDVSGTVLFDLFMAGATAFSTANYDALLIGWAAQTVQEFINIEFESQYTPGGAAEAARNTLMTTYSWTITDGGPA